MIPPRQVRLQFLIYTYVTPAPYILKVVYLFYITIRFVAIPADKITGDREKIREVTHVTAVQIHSRTTWKDLPPINIIINNDYPQSVGTRMETIRSRNKPRGHQNTRRKCDLLFNAGNFKLTT